ncbi:MAG: hypothetical protein ACTSQV_04650, partial [Alphaproteobacteria bacterium]
FGFPESIAMLAMVAVGGIGSVGGVAFAAVVMTVLPQWLQVIAEYKLLLYGALLFAVMRFSPGGLAGLVRSWRARAGSFRAAATRRSES